MVSDILTRVSSQSPIIGGARLHLSPIIGASLSKPYRVDHSITAVNFESVHACMHSLWSMSSC